MWLNVEMWLPIVISGGLAIIGLVVAISLWVESESKPARRRAGW